MRVLKLLGAETIICNDAMLNFHSQESMLTSTVTNAAGGLNPEYAVGDITVLNDVCNSS